MHFRRSIAILAIVLLAVLVVQPALSAENVTRIVTNHTEELEKDQGTILYNYGAQSLNLGDFDSAIRYFDQALAENTSMLKKTDALLYLYQNKAYVLIQQGKYADAVSTVDAGIAQYPRDPKLWNNKGYASYNLGKQQEALQAYDTALSFDGNYTNAWLNKGTTLMKMGRYPEAVAAFTRADETDPGNVAAAEGLAMAKQGDAESSRTMTIVLVVALIAAIGIVVWYVKFRKPAEPAPEEKKKSKKK